METLTKKINVTDIVECLTPDGWECGVVVKISNDIITVFMDHIQCETDFTIDLIR